MENINNTELPPIQTPSEPQLPPIETPITPKPTSTPSKSNLFKYLFIVCFIVLLASGISSFFLIKNLSSKLETKQDITEVTPTEVVKEVTPTITPISTVDQTSNWKTYTDKTLGFNFKYPNTVTLVDNDTIVKYPTIKIEVNKISDENFIKDKAARDNGENESYVGPYDLTNNPAKIIKISNNINARVTTTTSLFDVCSVMLHRRLSFYINDSRVDILYYYDGGTNLIPSNYLTTDKENCGDIKIWKGQEFYKDISNNQLENKTLQNWFNDFDKIITTIKFN